MNRRNEKAVAVLAAGGYFKKYLVHGFRGPKFTTHLFDAQNRRVPGVSYAARRDLDAMGCLNHDIGCAGAVERWTLQVPTDPAKAVAFDALLSTVRN